MGRGQGVDTDAVPTRQGNSSDDAIEFLSLGEHSRSVPKSIKWVGSATVVPCRQWDVDGKRIVEATRLGLGADNLLYVLRQRDIYERRLIGKNNLLASEVAILYKGNSVSGASTAMNEELKRLCEGTDFYQATRVMEVAGEPSTPRASDAPYSVLEVIDSLNEGHDSHKDEPIDDRSKRVMNIYGLRP